MHVSVKVKSELLNYFSAPSIQAEEIRSREMP